MTSSETGISADEASRIASEFRMRWQEPQAAQPKRRAWLWYWIALALVLGVLFMLPQHRCPETYLYLDRTEYTIGAPFLYRVYWYIESKPWWKGCEVQK